jgi:hypothetical protein
VVLARRRLPPRQPELTVEALSLPYVANICFKCFRRLRGMLQLIHIDVVKVDWGCCICCKCFNILQEFVQNVSSVPYVCCKRFDLDIVYVSHICCNGMF